MRVLIMFGSPGSGKGTQATLLGMRHISTGDILRNNVVAQNWMLDNPGKLCPDEMIDFIVQEKIMGVDASKDVVLDGYPRKLTQAIVLDKFLGEIEIPLIPIYLLVPIEEVIKRLALRGRPDDTPEIIKERLKVYESETVPVFEKLCTGREFFIVNALGDPQEVSFKIQKLIGGK